MFIKSEFNFHLSISLHLLSSNCFAKSVENVPALLLLPKLTNTDKSKNELFYKNGDAESSDDIAEANDGVIAPWRTLPIISRLFNTATLAGICSQLIAVFQQVLIYAIQMSGSTPFCPRGAARGQQGRPF